MLAACCLTILAVGENSTAIMAALPAMTANLGLEAATVEWVVNAYLLASAVFIVLGGEAADRFGASRSSATGIALFALASLVIALASDASVRRDDRRQADDGGRLARLVVGCGIALTALAGAGSAVLLVGLFAAGAGIALPYASAPRIGLAALPPSLSGKGSGILNSCSFLSGTVLDGRRPGVPSPTPHSVHCHRPA